MSAARKCDKCGKLFEPRPGDVTIDLSVVVPNEGVARVEETGWTEIELCTACSGPVVKLLKRCCNDFDDVVVGKVLGQLEPGA